MWSCKSLRTVDIVTSNCDVQVPESTDTLFFLLQKELRPSDVSNLGRIVLPKVSACCHQLLCSHVTAHQDPVSI